MPCSELFLELRVLTPKCASYLNPRLCPRPLHSHIQDKIFPHDLLRCPYHERSIWCRHYPRRMLNLPANRIQLESLDTRWLLWRSKIAGSIHWHCQSADGRDCSSAADARAVGFTNGCGEEIYIERHVWFGRHVRLFLRVLSARLSNTNFREDPS